MSVSREINKIFIQSEDKRSNTLISEVKPGARVAAAEPVAGWP